LRALGVEGFGLGLVQFVPTIALLGALAAAGDIVVSPVSPGAADNAAGVGVAVALHEELTRNPPAALAPALLLFGAGEGGPPAVRAHLRRERLDRTRVVVLELGPCGAGAPAYATAHPQLRAACERALGGATRAPLRRSTAAAAARSRRLPAAWIGALDADGIVPRSRQPSDTLERLDPAAGEAVLDFALACVDALDAELDAQGTRSSAIRRNPRSVRGAALVSSSLSFVVSTGSNAIVVGSFEPVAEVTWSPSAGTYRRPSQ
jgi:hypothetical protein